MLMVKYRQTRKEMKWLKLFVLSFNLNNKKGKSKKDISLCRFLCLNSQRQGAGHILKLKKTES